MFSFHIQPYLKDFVKACKRIQSDPNFQPHITNAELFNLVADEYGNPKHRPRKSALAIQPSTLKALSPEKELLGIVYQIKIARKSCVGEGSPIWNIDDSCVILIRKKDGEYSLHTRENAEKSIFDAPLSHISVAQFLNQPSLHLPKEEQKKSTGIKMI